MTNYEIMICIDKTNPYNRIFFPLCWEFRSRLLELGFKCEIVWGDVETNARKLIFGAHSSPKYWHENAKFNDIIVNLEAFHNPEWRRINPNFLELLKGKCVFDFCSYNLPFLEDGRLFKVPPLYSNLRPKKRKDSDVVFIGSRNKYRADMLNKIAGTGLNIKVGLDIFDNDIFHAFDESWIYLSLNLDEGSVFCDYRFMQCAMSNTLFAGHFGDITDCPEVKKLVGVSLFEKDADVLRGLQNLISNKADIMKALSIQYEIAQAYKNQFDSFVIQQFKV